MAGTAAGPRRFAGRLAVEKEHVGLDALRVEDAGGQPQQRMDVAIVHETLANGLGAASVPFIGCESSGQVGVLPAPKGTSWFVPTSPAEAQALAYYKSADGIGLLAPSGWYCQGVSGSGGYALYLSPHPIDRTLTDWKGFEGPAIQVNHITAENSGRCQIAEIMARVFPAYRALARRVWEGIDAPLPSRPYPHDTLTYRSQTIVEFKTPARTEGLGTYESWLGESDIPTAGVAILAGDPPDLVLLSVRLPRDLAPLTPVIVDFVERDSTASTIDHQLSTIDTSGHASGCEAPLLF
ncbi:MAG TPA: hypothetical protein VGF05_20350 [Bryobacteraceae bacterium]|jgi:hypothetical protein